MTRATVLAAGDCIDATALRPWLTGLNGGTVQSAVTETAAAGESLDNMERRLIESTLEKFNGHRGKTAEALGIGVRTLANKMRAYGYGPHDRTFSRCA